MADSGGPSDSLFIVNRVVADQAWSIVVERNGFRFRIRSKFSMSESPNFGHPRQLVLAMRVGCPGMKEALERRP